MSAENIIEKIGDIGVEYPCKIGGAVNHHWLIETPQGPTSNGVCTKCGDSKSFANNTDAVLNTDEQNIQQWRKRIYRARKVDADSSSDIDLEM